MIVTKQIKKDGNSHKISIDKQIFDYFKVKEGDYLQFEISEVK